MAFSDAAIRRVKSTEKQQKLSDGGGLFLLVHPNGSRYWSWKYRFGGKEKQLGMAAPTGSTGDSFEVFSREWLHGRRGLQPEDGGLVREQCIPDHRRPCRPPYRRHSISAHLPRYSVKNGHGWPPSPRNGVKTITT
ncbi:Arm DNA-binding domain-containing protein [Stenotrophomonas sp. 169]|uniref:Arm DNA-binding domain-containing protein n=1 Tax=Stenotrophomonas sp. 169 TaxID=2770322 RepID=UPI00315B2318